MTDLSRSDPAAAQRAHDGENRHHLRHEALTMALYVSICLLAELAALEDSVLHRGVVLAVVWGTTMGLALAHLFAFLLAGRLIEGRHLGAITRTTALAQLAGAAGVGVIVTVVIVAVPTTIELDAARYDLAAVIGVIGYVVARRADTSRIRALLFALLVTVAGVSVAVLKHWLGGH